MAEEFKYKDFEDFSSISTTDLSRTDLTKKKTIRLPFRGNPKKLQNLLESTLRDMGYSVLKNDLKADTGGFGDQVLDVKLNIFAEKRKDIKSKILERRPKHMLYLLFFGIILSIAGVSLKLPYLLGIGLICSFMGIIFYVSSPIEKIYTYHPCGISIWCDVTGQGFLGTKSEEVSERGRVRKGGTRIIKSTYLSSDLDVLIASEANEIKTNYIDKLLLDKEITSFSFSKILSSIYSQIKEITLEDPDKYNKLENTYEDVKNIVDDEMTELRERYQKFSDIY